MKVNKFILVCIFLLAVISLSPLSASEDVAGDELALDDTAEVSQVVQDDVVGDGEQNSGLRVDYPPNIATGDEGNITISGANDITGNLYWEFDGESSSISLADGKQNIAFKNLAEGDHPFLLKLTNDTKYADVEISDTIHVSKEISLTPNVPTVFNNNPTLITFTGPKVHEHCSLLLEIGNESFWGYYYAFGEGEVEINVAKTGTYRVNYFYENPEESLVAKGSFNLKVLSKPKLQAKSITMYDIESKYYKVRLLDSNGKPMAGEKVTVFIDLSKYKTAKTDKDGYAKVKIVGSDLYSDDLDLTTTYKTLSVHNRLYFKTVMKEITSFKKTNAKTVTFQIKTNKVNGKFLTGTKVTFKFNQKTYTAKINNKGIAKVDVKKSAFTKCKVGKIYQLKVTLGANSFTSNYKFLKVKPTLSYVSGMYAAGKS